MTNERADEIYAAYKAKDPMMGSSMPKDLLTAEEHSEVRARWDEIAKLPGGGSTCWMDAFYTFMSPDKLPPYMRQRCATIAHLTAQQSHKPRA